MGSVGNGKLTKSLVRAAGTVNCAGSRLVACSVFVSGGSLAEAIFQCDERKPNCGKCTAYGVSCNYDSQSADLQPLVDGTFAVQIPLQSALSPRPTMLTLMNASLGERSTKPGTWNSSQPLHWQDLELLDWFHARTALTLGTTRSRGLFRREIIRLASSVGLLNFFHRYRFDAHGPSTRS